MTTLILAIMVGVLSFIVGVVMGYIARIYYEASTMTNAIENIGRALSEEDRKTP